MTRMLVCMYLFSSKKTTHTHTRTHTHTHTHTHQACAKRYSISIYL